jgi:hypothetical protein
MSLAGCDIFITPSLAASSIESSRNERAVPRGVPTRAAVDRRGRAREAGAR